MANLGFSSRARFVQYLREIGAELSAGAAPAEVVEGRGPIPQRLRSRSIRGIGRQLNQLLRGHRARLGLALLVACVAALLGLVPMYGIKLAFDSILAGQPLPPGIAAWVPWAQAPRALLALVAWGTVGLAAVALVLSTWSRWQAMRIAHHLTMRLRRRLFEQALRLPLHRVYQLKTGGAASMLREDAGGVGDLVFALLYEPSRSLVQLFGSLLILAVVDARLLLGSLVLVGLIWLLHRAWIVRLRPLWRDIRQTRQEIDGYATEVMGGMRVVRCFGRQRSEAVQYVRSNHLMTRLDARIWWWMRGVDVVWALAVPLVTAILLFYGGGRVLSDLEQVKAGRLRPEEALTVGDVMMFLGYALMLLRPIATLSQGTAAIQNDLVGLERAAALLAEEREGARHPGKIRLERSAVRGQLRLRKVSFMFPHSATPALAGIDLEVEPGQAVALVGPSGSGKTTLCNLIARFYDPSIGSIELDGIDVRQINLESYRRLLGIVEQDTFLFDGTVAQNIAYGRRQATRQQIVEAARQANAHGFITAMARGYETRIGERGVRLSGGQRQRLAIARAILADPKILILDEATSNLDAESERLIQQSLEALMIQRTSVVVAHRLSTVKHAARIIVIEEGRIVEQGRHEELLARGGSYRKMVELQAIR